MPIWRYVDKLICKSMQLSNMILAYLILNGLVLAASISWRVSLN
jgi:hypothetical protein